MQLLERKDMDKRWIWNWRPISLLNTDLEIYLKAFAAKLEFSLTSFVASQQTVYVQKTYIGEEGSLLSDILHF